jgi:outer membrane protein assembly factor BamB
MNSLRAVCLVVVLSVPALAGDWPQWLGPHRDGTSTEKVKRWKGKLKVVWKKAVGAGHSSPVVAGGKVYLHTRGPNKKVPGADEEKEQEQVTVYDAKTGEKVWSTPYVRDKFFSIFGTGPQATPAVSGGKVYTFGATGVLACFDAKGGKADWDVPTQKVFKAPSLFFGAACSPLIDGDNVIVNVGGKGASVVAFRKDKGEVAWKSLDDKASYSSGVVVGQGADRQIVFLTQQGLRGLSPRDGKKLWEFPLVDKLNESSTTPVVVGDILLASSVTYGMVGLKLESKGGKHTATQLWKNPKLTCYFSTPIPVGKKHVYVVTGMIGFRPTSALHCVEVETGKVLWSKPKVGKYHAALLRTGNDKLLMLSDLGDLVLFDPDPKEYKELARGRVVKGEQIWAHPALADGKVYFRDEKELICLEVKE